MRKLISTSLSNLPFTSARTGRCNGNPVIRSICPQAGRHGSRPADRCFGLRLCVPLHLFYTDAAASAAAAAASCAAAFAAARSSLRPDCSSLARSMTLCAAWYASFAAAISSCTPSAASNTVDGPGGAAAVARGVGGSVRRSVNSGKDAHVWRANGTYQACRRWPDCTVRRPWRRPPRFALVLPR